MERPFVVGRVLIPRVSPKSPYRLPTLRSPTLMKGRTEGLGSKGYNTYPSDCGFPWCPKPSVLSLGVKLE